jgi:hypothetical protein
MKTRLSQAFECEKNDDAYLTCKVDAENYLEIGVEDSEEIITVSIGYSQISNLIEYLQRVQSSIKP